MKNQRKKIINKIESEKIQRNLKLFERANEKLLLEEKLKKALYDLSSFIENEHIKAKEFKIILLICLEQGVKKETGIVNVNWKNIIKWSTQQIIKLFDNKKKKEKLLNVLRTYVKIRIQKEIDEMKVEVDRVMDEIIEQVGEGMSEEEKKEIIEYLIEHENFYLKIVEEYILTKLDYEKDKNKLLFLMEKGNVDSFNKISFKKKEKDLPLLKKWIRGDIEGMKYDMLNPLSFVSSFDFVFVYASFHEMRDRRSVGRRKSGDYRGLD
eukprot:TRINITY_DN1994_c2_g1_i1.p1 TRINITY_DN1994_c2_g1~~TRINITY_DN1994_c2_g1_i1.p1  ORF type:complete len:266 (-),score=86.02 TRINITY_DN1994_c2_g1_i1:362-1159(-)